MACKSGRSSKMVAARVDCWGSTALCASPKGVRDDVCITGTSPTIREAVVCTVTSSEYPTRGNTNPASVGLSTHGPPLLAARVGSPNGKRVMLVTQLHGNTPASTEAVLRFLDSLKERTSASDALLASLELLFIVRANPDGGEPGAETDPPLGIPFTPTEGFFRHTVDSTAGGGFTETSEPGFFGAVGRGYDLNRYNFLALDAPIRPIESQALVAAFHSFDPSLIIDLHGDPPQVDCDIDPKSIEPDVLFGPLPTGRCCSRSVRLPTVFSDRPRAVIATLTAEDDGAGSVLSDNTLRLRAVVRNTVDRVQQQVEGVVSRFNQIDLGVAALSAGALHKAARRVGKLGSAFGVLNFATAVRPTVLGLRLVDGDHVSDVGPDTYLPEPFFLADGICLNELILQEMLGAYAQVADEPVDGQDEGFCDIPLSNGILVSAPAEFGWGSAAVEQTVLVPQGGFYDVMTGSESTTAHSYSCRVLFATINVGRILLLFEDELDAS